MNADLCSCCVAACVIVSVGGPRRDKTFGLL